jgi:hypothetical protein
MDNLKALPLMPLRELVVFPQTAVPLLLEGQKASSLSRRLTKGINSYFLPLRRTQR